MLVVVGSAPKQLVTLKKKEKKKQYASCLGTYGKSIVALTLVLSMSKDFSVFCIHN